MLYNMFNPRLIDGKINENVSLGCSCLCIGLLYPSPGLFNHWVSPRSGDHCLSLNQLEIDHSFLSFPEGGILAVCGTNLRKRRLLLFHSKRNIRLFPKV